MEKNTTAPQPTEQNIDNTQDLVNARKEALAQMKEKEPSQGFELLNEHRRQFLASGYLTEGATPEGRIREIADRAESILGIPGYADKFYNYMSEGFFSLASPVWSNFGKRRGL